VYVEIIGSIVPTSFFDTKKKMSTERDAKRRKIEKMEYTYLIDIPEGLLGPHIGLGPNALITILYSVSTSICHFLVMPINTHTDKPRSEIVTKPEEWGPREVAAARAESEPEVTKDNEQLFRTYHPSLRCAAWVSIFTGPYGDRVWAIEQFAGPPRHTHAGGLEIHVLTTSWPHNSFNFPRFAADLLGHNLNPRRLLSNSNLTAISEMFPNAIGVQVLIGGRVHVVYQDWTAIQKDWSSGVPDEVGSLGVRFTMVDVIPS
jgi:hypothetical protein